MMLSAKFKAWCAGPLFVVAAFALYSNTLSSAFHFDDFIFIVHNPALTDPLNIPAIWNEGSAPTRFVAKWTFAWNYHFHRYDVTGYHIVNILIHGINAALVCCITMMLGRQLESVGRWNSRSIQPVAVLAAVIFLCHPLQTQAVTYLCQRFASLATMFYLLSVACFLYGRRTVGRRAGWWCAAVIAGLLGMFTKQIVMTLPVMILLIEWMFFREARIDARGLLRHWRPLLTAAVLLGVIPAVYSFDVAGILLREYDSLSHRGDTLNAWSYFLTQSRVIWTYIRLLLFPAEQNLLYDFSTSYSWWDIRVLAGYTGIAVLVAGAIQFRRRYPLAAFGILWFFTTLLVESSIIPIRHVIFEHRVYLPMFGFALAAAHPIVNGVRRPAVSVTLAVLVTITLSVLTYRRNAVWKDGVSLWSDVLSKSPQLIRPYTHLATAYLNRGDYERALEIYTQAIAVDPQRAESYNNRGNVYAVLRRYDLALADYQHALELDPTLEKTYNNVGTIYNKRKQFVLAVQNYDRALEINPANAAAYFNRANVYLQKNELEKAFADYTRSIEQNPFQKKAYYYRSQIYATQGDYQNALADILEAETLGVKVDQGYISELKRKIGP